MNSRTTRAWGAVATMVGVAMFVIVVLILHFIQPGYEPRHQLVSELALGQYGWSMFVAFLGLATAVLGVQSASATLGGFRGYRVLLGVAAPRAVSWSLAAGVAASVALGDSVIPMGIAQRLAATCLLLWLGIVGWRLFRL